MQALLLLKDVLCVILLLSLWPFSCSIDGFEAAFDELELRDVCCQPRIRCFVDQEDSSIGPIQADDRQT